MSRPTPGPWTVEEMRQTRGLTLAVRRKQRGEFDHPTIVAYVPDNPRSQFRANACLIAAAPDMLDVLKSILSECEADHFEWESFNNVVDQVREVIAKIEAQKK